MRIRHWKELDGFKCGEYNLSTVNNDGTIQIFKGDDYCCEFKPAIFSNENIIAHLALLGIKIEFEEEQTLTKKECYFLKYITEGLAEDLTITRNKSGRNLFVEYDFNDRSSRAFEASATTNLFPWFKIGKSYLASDLKKLPSWVN